MQTAVVAQTQVARLQQETRSRQLAEAAQNQPSQHPYLALLLAIEAERRAPVLEADQALRSVLSNRLAPSIVFSHDKSVGSAVWNADGSRILTTSGNAAQVWDSRSGTLLLTLQHNDDGGIRSAAWDQDESRILTNGDRIVRVWDAQSGTLLLNLTHNHGVYDVAWSHSGSYILTSGRELGAVVWDASSGAQLFRIPYDGAMNSAVWSQGDDRILTASENGTAQVWEVSSGALLLTLAAGGGVDSAAWSPDERHILTQDYMTAQVWDARSGARLVTLTHDADVSSAAWSRDRSRILTTSGSTAQWSQDERRVLTARWDGTAQIHMIIPADLMSYACQYAPHNLSQAEWGQYLPGETYASTCTNLPPGPGAQ